MTVSSLYSQKSNNQLLIGEWQGPNNTTLILKSNGSGLQKLTSLGCDLKMKSWSATGNILTIYWDMTPIQCTDNKGNPYTHTPKIERDQPVFTITQQEKFVSGLKMTEYKLVLDNKEFNSYGIYFRYEIPESDE